MATRATIPKKLGENFSVGSIVVVEVTGTVISMSDSFEDPDNIEIEVEGDSTKISPGTLDDAMKVAFTKLSNAKGPEDFPSGQRELHAP